MHNRWRYREAAPLAPSSTNAKVTQSSLVTQTASTWDPATQRLPEQKSSDIDEELSEAWVNYPTLFEDLYYDQAHDVAHALFTRAKGDKYSIGHWTDIPENPSDKSQIQAAFMSIAAMAERHIEKSSSLPLVQVVDMSDKPLETRDEGSLLPDLFFVGSGSQISVVATIPGQSVEWKHCIVPANILTQAMDITSKGESLRLGTYAEEIFSTQENRRFIPAFTMDEVTFRFLTFDRGGVVEGSCINYHTNPRKLCALFEVFLLKMECDIGFDPTIFYKDDRTWITATPKDSTLPPVTYCVEQTLLHSADIRGAGTIYWITRPPYEEDKNYYLIKDSWIIGGCQHERQFLNNTSGIEGVAPILDVQDVYFNGRLDSVSNNRPIGVETPMSENRIHTRAILYTTAGAKLLDKFSDIQELLVAIRDAVYGHFNLYTSGILHRNITPTNILIQPEAKIGSRGVLLNLESAMHTHSRSDRPAGTLGTRAFYSCKSLRGPEDLDDLDIPGSHGHTYLDDLESFFYVLCYIVCCHEASGPTKSRIAPRPISQWFEDGGLAVKSYAFMKTRSSYPVHPSFGGTVILLLENLFKFFKVRKVHKIRTSQSASVPTKDYTEFLACFDNAIAELNGGIESPERGQIISRTDEGLQQQTTTTHSEPIFENNQNLSPANIVYDTRLNWTGPLHEPVNLLGDGTLIDQNTFAGSATGLEDLTENFTEADVAMFLQQLCSGGDLSQFDGVMTEGNYFQSGTNEDTQASGSLELSEARNQTSIEDAVTDSSYVGPNPTVFHDGSANINTANQFVGTVEVNSHGRYLRRQDRPEDFEVPPASKRSKFN